MGGEEVLIEILDIEASAGGEQPPPRARRYRLRIDGEHYIWERHTITGREILELAKRSPVDDFLVYEHRRHHRPRLVKLDEHVELHRHHLERFTTPRRGAHKVTIVVNGTPTEVRYDPEAEVGTLIEPALEQTHNTGRPPEDWILRDAAGHELDLTEKIECLHLTPHSKLFLSLKAGVGG